MFSTSSVNTVLLRKFNESFKKDDDGKSRDWRQIEENTIKELYDKCKARVEVLLDEFKKIVFPKNVTRMDALGAPEDFETPGEDTFDTSKLVR